MAKLSRPKKNSLWSRKDARRPAVVRVTKLVRRSFTWGGGYYYAVQWEDTSGNGRKGEVVLDQWHRRYREFVAPTTTSPPTDGAEGK